MIIFCFLSCGVKFFGYLVKFFDDKQVVVGVGIPAVHVVPNEVVVAVAAVADHVLEFDVVFVFFQLENFIAYFLWLRVFHVGLSEGEVVFGFYFIGFIEDLPGFNILLSSFFEVDYFLFEVCVDFHRVEFLLADPGLRD